MQQSRKAKRRGTIINKKEHSVKSEKKKTSLSTKTSRTFIAISIIGIIIYYILYKLTNMFGFIVFDNKSNEDPTKTSVVESFKKKDEVSILFAGTDESGLRTDSIMYIKYDTVHDLLYMMSIPRDTYTTNSKANYKINSIYDGGKNTEALVKEVEDMLDVKLDYYFIMDLDLISQVVNALGGIQMDIKEDVWKLNKSTGKWTKFLSKGIQTLSAAQIETLVRNRDYDVGDIKREETQREVIVAMIQNMLDAKNLLKAPKIINIMLANTNTNITTREAIAYAMDIKNVKMDKITSTVMPWTFYNINGVSCVLVDKSEAREMISNWAYKEPVQEVEKEEVVNTN